MIVLMSHAGLRTAHNWQATAVLPSWARHYIFTRNLTEPEMGTYELHKVC
jgi:hypothetical protein